MSLQPPYSHITVKRYHFEYSAHDAVTETWTYAVLLTPVKIEVSRFHIQMRVNTSNLLEFAWLYREGGGGGVKGILLAGCVPADTDRNS